MIYDYTTGAVSNPETGIDYQYTDDSKAGWKKLLTSIVYKTYSYTEEYPNGKSTVVSTETVNYDAIGNPTNYQGATVEWYGRQMTSYSKGDVSATFTYDADGLRGSKTVNGSKTTYFYVGDQLMYECRGDGIELYFYYDSYGNLSVIRYVNGTNSYYYYVTTNSQGDVLGIYSATGELKASYEYDTWGNCTIVFDTSGINIATVNPIRYRGYYYDNDLGLYYLQSRYYDSTIGRFLNADGYITTNTTEPLAYNMFAYCKNNPINMVDKSGKWPLKAAFDFLFNWLFGNGEKKTYTERSRISKKIKESSKMQEKVDDAIENYKQGQSTTTGTGEFTADEDGYELYLSTQHFEYSIAVEEEVRTKGVLFWKHEESRFVATVTVSDEYNFDNLREWNSFGNVMNNIAYKYHEYGGGNDFEWCATYKYSTKWTDVA